jgi:hypothetical protein
MQVVWLCALFYRYEYLSCLSRRWCLVTLQGFALCDVSLRENTGTVICVWFILSLLGEQRILFQARMQESWQPRFILCRWTDLYVVSGQLRFIEIISYSTISTAQRRVRRIGAVSPTRQLGLLIARSIKLYPHQPLRQPNKRYNKLGLL